jgi:GNAT superfamily N-acetyltransferase
MLVQAKDAGKVIAAVAPERAHAFILRYWMESFSREEPPSSFLLTDDPENPSLLVLHSGAQIFALARRLEGYKRMADDLLHERIEQEPAWPDKAVTRSWEHWMLAKGLFVNSSPLVLWEFMMSAGFESQDDNHAHHAYLWTIEGEPRFSHLVKHPCRLGEGEELWEHLRKGIAYDEEGEYVRSCIQRGPSFVCEVGGEKVCWSATHMNGTMAMIYTPPEHRRKGYAKSLAAFQIDYMLREHGVACAHVISTNVESARMMEFFGARRIHEPCVWRVIYYPGEAEKAHRRAQERSSAE